MKTREQKAKFIFARDREAQVVHFTSDDTPFKEKHRAEAHAQRLKNPKIGSIKRGEDQVKAKVKDLTNGTKKPKSILDGNVGEVAGKVAGIENVEELKALSEKEAAGDDRKGVQKAISERIEALSQGTDEEE